MAHYGARSGHGVLVQSRRLGSWFPKGLQLNRGKLWAEIAHGVGQPVGWGSPWHRAAGSFSSELWLLSGQCEVRGQSTCPAGWRIREAAGGETCTQCFLTSTQSGYPGPCLYCKVVIPE